MTAVPRRWAGRPGRVRRTWARHPRLGLAVKAALAAALRSVEDAAADPEALGRARACLDEFTAAVRRARATTTDDLFVAGDVVQAVRRSLDALRARELAG